MNNQIVNEIVKSINQLTDEKMSRLPFIYIQRGKVVAIYEFHCVVEIDGVNYNCKIKNGIRINVGDTVLVNIINNNFSEKYVDGKLGKIGSDDGGQIVGEVLWSNIVGKPSSEPINIDDAVTKRHEHNNLTLLQSITQTLIDRWNSAWEHITDLVKHIALEERTLWNTVSSKANSTDLTNHTGNNGVHVTTIEKNTWNNAEPSFTKNTAFNKNFGAIAGTVCEGNDGRLSDSRTPLTHSHSISEVSLLQDELNVKVNASDVLKKDNAVIYTPTQTYHPATKKYVDDSLVSAGAGDMLKTTYDTNNNGKVDVAEVAESVNWSNITGSPIFATLPDFGLQTLANPERGRFNPLWVALSSGRPMYGDEEFTTGNNSVFVYNNSGGSGVTFLRKSDASAPNKSGMVLEFTHTTDATSPDHGGFLLTISSRRNAVFAQRFRAKLPVGYEFMNAENSQGTNSNVYWLTSRLGTGKWEEYIRVVQCGNTGTFSSGGHVYILGGAKPFTWQLASCNVFEVESSRPVEVFQDNSNLRYTLHIDSQGLPYFMEV